MKLLHVFWLAYEALGGQFKETWVILNLNATITFISDIKNEDNEQGDSDNFIIEVKVCDVGTLQKPLLIRRRRINTFSAQVFQYFNSRK